MQERIEGPRVFCATTKPAATGESVLLEINFPGLPNRVVLRGWTEEWKPAVPRLGIRAGVYVDLEPNQEESWRYLISIANGTRQPGKRRHTRLPVELPARLRERNSTKQLEAHIAEVSVSGVLVRIAKKLEPDTEVVMEVRMPGAAEVSEVGCIVRKCEEGYASLDFIVRDAGASRRLREFVRRLRAIS